MPRRFWLPVSLALNLILLAALLVPLPRTGAQTTTRYFPETHHYVKGKFLQYWTDHGGLSQQGYPLTEEFSEQNPLNGLTYTVQYFQRAIFEAHPEFQPPYDVLLSQLGKVQLDSRYPNGSNPAAAPQPPPSGGQPTATGAPVPPTAPPTVPVPPTAVVPGTATAPVIGGYTATASVSDATPARREDVTVTGVLLVGGRPVVGAKMLTTWNFASTTSHCDEGVTDATGTAKCLYSIGGATPGFKVVIDVVFQDAATGATLATTSTNFTPR